MSAKRDTRADRAVSRDAGTASREQRERSIGRQTARTASRRFPDPVEPVADDAHAMRHASDQSQWPLRLPATQIHGAHSETRALAAMHRARGASHASRSARACGEETPRFVEHNDPKRRDEKGTSLSRAVPGLPVHATIESAGQTSPKSFGKPEAAGAREETFAAGNGLRIFGELFRALRPDGQTVVAFAHAGLRTRLRSAWLRRLRSLSVGP